LEGDDAAAAVEEHAVAVTGDVGGRIGRGLPQKTTVEEVIVSGWGWTAKRGDGGRI